MAHCHLGGTKHCPLRSAYLRVGEVSVLHRVDIEDARREVRAGGDRVSEVGPIHARVLQGRAPEVAPLEIGLDQVRLEEAAPLQVAAGKVGRLCNH